MLEDRCVGMELEDLRFPLIRLDVDLLLKFPSGLSLLRFLWVEFILFSYCSSLFVWLFSGPSSSSVVLP